MRMLIPLNMKPHKDSKPGSDQRWQHLHPCTCKGPWLTCYVLFYLTYKKLILKKKFSFQICSCARLFFFWLWPVVVEECWKLLLSGKKLPTWKQQTVIFTLCVFIQIEQMRCNLLISELYSRWWVDFVLFGLSLQASSHQTQVHSMFIFAVISISFMNGE